MEVVNPRSALLSNYEVLELLREMENDHITRSKTAVRIKKEEEAAGISSSILPGGRDRTVVEISENLRTVEVEAIKYLTASFQPTSAQSPERITELVKALEPYGFTKAEKLQIVNLAPTLPVELYVIVEELEDRLGESMDDVLALVQRSVPGLGASGSDSDEPMEIVDAGSAGVPPASRANDWDLSHHADGGYDPNDIVYDDTGEGAGVEGDLDVDDD